VSETVLRETREGICTITLNRPAALNAMNAALLEATAAAFDAAHADPAVRVIVFTGAGRAFCAGDDLKEHRHPRDEAEARERVERIQRVTRSICLGDRFVIGAINGWAVGGGFEWALNCDLTLWAESARAFFPEYAWGMFVTGGVTALLARMVGLNKAREMLLLGERYTARELHEAGAAWRVVADERLLEEASAVARRIAALPPAPLADLRRALRAVACSELERAIELESEATVRAFLDPATSERIEAFRRR